MKKPRLTTPITLTLGADIIEWLDELARKRRTSKSQIVREILVPIMEKDVAAEGEQRPRPTKPKAVLNAAH